MEVPTESLDKSLLEFNNLLSPANSHLQLLSFGRTLQTPARLSSINDIGSPGNTMKGNGFSGRFKFSGCDNQWYKITDMILLVYERKRLY